MISLDVRRLDERAKLPTRAYADDAGLDICALEAAELGPGERTPVRTGIQKRRSEKNNLKTGFRFSPE